MSTALFNPRFPRRTLRIRSRRRHGVRHSFRLRMDNNRPTRFSQRVTVDVGSFCSIFSLTLDYRGQFVGLNTMTLTLEQWTEAFEALAASDKQIDRNVCEAFEYVLDEVPVFGAGSENRCERYYRDHIQPILDSAGVEFWRLVDERKLALQANLAELTGLAAHLSGPALDYFARVSAEQYCGPYTARLFLACAVADIITRFIKDKRLENLSKSDWLSITLMVLRVRDDLR